MAEEELLEDEEFEIGDDESDDDANMGEELSDDLDEE